MLLVDQQIINTLLMVELLFKWLMFLQILPAANYAIQVQDLTALPTICVVNATETVGLASLFSLNPAAVSNVSCGAGAN